SAMIHLLKMPKVIGTFYPGENGHGYVFQDRDRLVAMAFKIDPEKPGPSVAFSSSKVLDMYANPLSNKKQTLDIDPVWIEDIAANDAFVQQCDFAMDSKHYIRGAAGDTITLKFSIHNQQKKAYEASLSQILPEGWEIIKSDTKVHVQAGEEKYLSAQIKIAVDATAGDHQVWNTIDNASVSKKIRCDVQVVPAASLGTITLSGRPGATKLPFTLRNNSLKKRSYRVIADLPDGWSAQSAELEFKNMSGGSLEDSSFSIIWNSSYSANKPAQLLIKDETGTTVYKQGIVPSAFAVPQAKKITCDGDLSDWPAAATLPDWIVGSIGITKKLQLRTAYAKEGLYFAVEVAPSDAAAVQPSWFWTCDALEVCIDTTDDKTERDSYQKTDHQFWLVPQVADNSVYMGRWKRNNEIEKIMYDIKNTGASKKTDKGYILEAFIPASAITGYTGKAGQKIGISLSLTVPSKYGGQVDAYWPLPKTENIISKPHLWGTVELK
ncbi:MAG: hypothetical protein HRU15_09035, partial [Planctomycetes bacterium]|nr:hypothetical protein [Planctomycetota bacterium]